MNALLNFSPMKFVSQNMEPSSALSIPLGISIGLVASFIQSLGLTIQRKSHVLNQALPEHQQKVEHRRPLWLLGFAIFISSNLFGSLVQIASLPVVILAPLGAVSLLWNAFFARMLLGDAFSLWMGVGTLLIAGGATLIALFGVVPEPTHSLEDLLVLFARPAFITYFSLLGFFVVSCLVITHALEYSYSRRPLMPAATPPPTPANTGSGILATATSPPTHASRSTSAATERTPLLDRKQSRTSSPLPTPSKLSDQVSSLPATRMLTLLAMSYASFSGIIAGMCLLFAKSGVELLVLTIAGHNQFWRWQAWVLVIGLGICALLQLWYMHKGLILANPTLVCPLAFCFYNISTIINGLVYFDQFSLLSLKHLCLVMLGMAVLLAGVWIVSLPPGGVVGVDIHQWDEEQLDLVEAVEEVVCDQPSHREVRLEGDAVPGKVPRRGGYYTMDVGTSPRQASPTRRRLDSAPVPPAGWLDAVDSSPAIQNILSPNRDARSLAPISSAQQFAVIPRQSMHHVLPFPLSPGSTHGTLGGGFSIGLSPVSPAFALVPTRRRRRTGSNAADGPGLDLRVNGCGAPGKRPRRGSLSRRAVSEGDLVISPISDVPLGEGEEAPLLGDGLEEAAARPSDIDSLPEQTPGRDRGKHSRHRGRWKWLANLFSPFRAP